MSGTKMERAGKAADLQIRNSRSWSWLRRLSCHTHHHTNSSLASPLTACPECASGNYTMDFSGTSLGRADNATALLELPSLGGEPENEAKGPLRNPVS